MSRLELVQQEILELTPLEQQQFQVWYAELSESIWDQQLEEDIVSGRLNALAAKAVADFEAGYFKKL